MLANLVFRVLEVEHEGSVFVLVFAVSVHVQIEHFFLNADSQLAHLTLRHGEIITVAHPTVQLSVPCIDS